MGIAYFSNHGSPSRLADLVSSSDMDGWPSREPQVAQTHKRHGIWTMPQALGPWRSAPYITIGMPLDIIASLREVVKADASLFSWDAVWQQRILVREYDAQQRFKHMNVLKLQFSLHSSNFYQV